MTIKFLNCNSTNINIKIYNTNNDLICEKQVIQNKIELDLPNNIYIIHIYNNNCLIAKTVLIIKDNYKCITYEFNNTKTRQLNIKTFILDDYHYSGLKIERGSLLLKNII